MNSCLKKGFTLVELMIVVLLTSMLLLAYYRYFQSLNSNWKSMHDLAEKSNSENMLENSLQNDISQIKFIPNLNKYYSWTADSVRFIIKSEHSDFSTQYALVSYTRSNDKKIQRKYVPCQYGHFDAGTKKILFFTNQTDYTEFFSTDTWSLNYYNSENQAWSGSLTNLQYPGGIKVNVKLDTAEDILEYYFAIFSNRYEF